MSSVKRWEGDITSHLRSLSSLLSPHSLSSPSHHPRMNWCVCAGDRSLSAERRWSLVHVTLPAIAAHQLLGKHGEGAGCEDVTEPLMNGRQLPLLLTHVCWACHSPSEGFIILPFFFRFCFVCFCQHPHPLYGNEGLSWHRQFTDWRVANLCCFACENESVARCEMKVTSQRSRWNDSSSCVWSD